MDPLARDAWQILETAAASAAPPSSWTILAGRDGIRMLAGNDWPLASLRREHGADRAYRVSRDATQIAVIAESATLRCELSRPAPAAAATFLLASRGGGVVGSAAR